MKKDASAIGFIGIPDEESIKMLEKELRKPIKKIEKKGKIILLIGKGLFKKKIIIPIENMGIIGIPKLTNYFITHIIRVKYVQMEVSFHC
jgi:hypothetical protein